MIVAANTSNIEYVMNEAGIVGLVGAFFVLCAVGLAFSAANEGILWVARRMGWAKPPSPREHGYE